MKGQHMMKEWNNSFDDNGIVEEKKQEDEEDEEEKDTKCNDDFSFVGSFTIWSESCEKELTQ